MLWDNVISGHIRRCNQNLLAATIVAGLGWLVLFVYLFVEGSTNWPTVLVFIFGIAAVGWILNVALRRRANPDKHPILTSLSRFDAEPKEVAAEIDREVSGNAVSYHRGKVILTPNWILHSRIFGLDI